MRRTRLTGTAVLIGLGLVPAVGYAQVDSPLVTPSIPDSFDRGRNVSVTQRSRPDYDALGVQVSSFKVFPRIDTGIGYSSNVFVSGIDPKSDEFVDVAPSVVANSDWSSNMLQMKAGGQFRRFLDTPRRNENTWNVASLGRLDFGSAYALTGEAQFARVYESPFSGEVSSNLAVLSSYYRSFLAARGQYQAGQGRITLAVDRGTYDFSPIPLAGGGKRDQSDRNRNIVRGSGQLEYAFTPSFSVWGQVQYTDTSYDRSTLLIGGPNRDSQAIRAIAGVSLDLAGFLRGTVGAGYTRRDYDSPVYVDVGGFSVEGKLEYFPTELTTVTIGASRVLQDSSIGTASAYFDNRLSGRVDHELLNNLLLNITGDIGRQTFFGIAGKTNLYRVGGGARYLMSHKVALEGNVSYSRQDTTISFGTDYDETRAQARITFQL